ncbi:MAG TPA: creatininase family protein [Edaphobacter sp.]|nr:creatininase family protein [Edaphobacter sp.]
MLLQEMTWQEINALDRSTIVVATFGAIEQHGTHLPLETDALIGREIARRLDAACGGRLLILPTQWLGLSLHHMSFSGTLTASVDTYLAMVFDLLGSVAQAGFQKIMVINSHGGNVSALDLVLTKCREQYPKTRMIGVTYWNAAATQLNALRESAVGGMGHACELETSLVLAIRPDLVRGEHVSPDGRQALSEFLSKDMLVGGSVSISRHFSEISKHGAVGDPRTASAEKGERFFEVIVARLAKLVGEIESGQLDGFRPIGE